MSNRRVSTRRNGRRRPGKASTSGARTGGHPLQAAKLQVGPYNDFVPARWRTKMKYVASFVNATSATPAQVIFTANTVFDPGNTSDTHHCVGYDALALLYSRYRVFGSTLHVKADMEASSSGIGATQVGASIVAWPSTTSTVAGSYVTATAQTGAKNVEFNGTSRALIRHAQSVQALAGIRLIEGSDDYAAATGAQPTKKTYWNVLWVSSVAQTGVNLNVTITMVVDVEWYGRYDLALPTITKLRSLVDENKQYLEETKAVVERQVSATMATAKFWDDAAGGTPESKVERESAETISLPDGRTARGYVLVDQTEHATPKGTPLHAAGTRIIGSSGVPSLESLVRKR